ncbi:OLC1v1021958C1 [Oldenlandia corymbosa var. corymbosa]|uniref:OLC1v1021958C1 n=1 Tax=Oldenlandia corymbosa var. corymbosa TaxID=529605 RepID=A0AAV1BZE2_OLDCO|nr:OLC1v1021958C1 [Oldenlandia corymbosa var. corymbosa]
MMESTYTTHLNIGFIMKCLYMSMLLCLCDMSFSVPLETNLHQFILPNNFLFGTASSSYQFEGAFSSEGKGLSNWDIFSHQTGNILDGSNGDVAVDHYHRYLEDINLMKDLGVNSYRFSLSWARILPRGRFGNVNMAGIEHYNKLIDALLQKGIYPFVSLTHYDIPQELEDRYGAWLSPKVQDDFRYYAEICFKYFGDRVKHWVTFNEPNVVAIRGYRSGIYPPGRCSALFGNCSSGDSEKEPLIAAHNMILSHASAVDTYRTRYQKTQGGSIGIVINAIWYEPFSDSSEDKSAAERAQSFFMNWFLDPIIFGRYPAEMQQILGSQLPTFSRKDLNLMRHGVDFIGINHYTSFYAKDCLYSACQSGGPGVSKPEGYFLRTAVKDGIPIGESTDVDWINIYPPGMENVVTYIKDRYNNTPMFITENGLGQLSNPRLSATDFVFDYKRVEYMNSYLISLASAMRKGADVRGYFAWALLDNFEWISGYAVRFGLHHIDYATLKRTPKLSAIWFKHRISNHSSFPNNPVIDQRDRESFRISTYYNDAGKQSSTNKSMGNMRSSSFLLLSLELPVFLSPLISANLELNNSLDLDESLFPPNFLFGTASSAYQYEGAILTDGKSLSNWDVFTHNSEFASEGNNGDVAVDQYHRYQEHVDIMASFGLNSYQFSISWARILPKGVCGSINLAGIQYYNKLIDALLLKGIQPFVVLNHFDIPDELEQRYGSWLSPRFVKDFKYFADICFKNFGDRVKYWVTFSEPNLYVMGAYRSGFFPPNRCSKGFGYCTAGDSEKEPFIAAHNVILAHAAAVKIYKTKYQKLQGGSIGFIVQTAWYEPLSNSTADKLATERAHSFFYNWFLEPIIHRRYPKEMTDLLGSTLPRFSSNDLEDLKLGVDFIGINHYTTLYIGDCMYSYCEPLPGTSRTEGYVRQTFHKDGIPIGELTGDPPLRSYPPGMEKTVTYVKERYNNIPIFITENGYCEKTNPNSTFEESLNDDKRIQFLNDYLYYLSRAMGNGAEVRGYFAWTLLDDYEWLKGYIHGYGLHHVDHNTLKSTPKKSATWYKDFIAKHTRNPRIAQY